MTWENLPPLVMNHVFSFLSLSDQFNCILVCTYWRDLLVNFDEPKQKWIGDGRSSSEVEIVLEKITDPKLSNRKRIRCKKYCFDWTLLSETDCICHAIQIFYFIDVLRLFQKQANLVRCIILRMMRKMKYCKYINYEETPVDNTPHTFHYKNCIYDHHNKNTMLNKYLFNRHVFISSINSGIITQYSIRKIIDNYRPLIIH